MATEILERHSHPKYARLSIQLRSNSAFYQAVTFLDGKLRQNSTKTRELATAFKLAGDWYARELRASVTFGHQHPIDRLTGEPLVGEVFRDYRRTLSGEKGAFVDWRWSPIQEFWRTIKLREVTALTFRDFYRWRRRRTKGIKAHTLHKDVVLIRQVFKYALEQALVDQLPAIPKPGKIDANPRPWFTKDEWAHLVNLSRLRIKEAGKNPKLHRQREALDDFIWWLHASMMRVNEARNVRVRQCRSVLEGDPPHLLVDVKGKTGIGRRSVAPRRWKSLSVERKHSSLTICCFPPPNVTRFGSS
jgi:hypothetical protein